jgi:hypothetical protein
MSTVAAPYGFRPINLIGGQQFAGSTRKVSIASGYATNIFYGDIVALNSSGVLVKVTATGVDGTTNALPAGVLGIFLGCSYTDPTYGFTSRQYYPASTVAADILAFVCDDPDTLFQAQANGALAQTTLGNNIALVQTAGSTTTGNSAVALLASSAATSTFLPFRIVDFVNNSGSGSIVGDAYTDVIVKFNFGIHSYTSATGV